MKIKKILLTTSFSLLRQHGACESGYRKLAKALGGVDQYGVENPINVLTILETNGLDDCLWSLRATHQDADIISRLMAAQFAEAVLPIWERENPDDMRPRNAINAARDFACGKIDEAELATARYAARTAALTPPTPAAAAVAAAVAAAAAARNEVREAAVAAAVAAARDEGRTEGRDTAQYAAQVSAWDAAWDEAQDAQANIVRAYLIGSSS